MFQRICVVAMFVAALFISVIPNADARQDIYAFTYNGNNWYAVNRTGCYISRCTP